jgi:atypical dual specificity phosphatase
MTVVYQVHCFQGVSRSATVVCAYVIARAANGMTAAEAIDKVRAKRGVVCPNYGFRLQLATYSERFVGNRGKPGNGQVLRRSGRSSKISDGIADRIRRFRGGGSNTVALQPIKVKEGA